MIAAVLGFAALVLFFTLQVSSARERWSRWIGGGEPVAALPARAEARPAPVATLRPAPPRVAPSAATPAPARQSEPPAAAASGSGRLVVALLSSAGSPLREAQVALQAGSVARRVASDARGEALFEGLGAGRYALALEVPGQPRLVSPTPLALAADEEKRVVLRIPDHRLSISGRVLTAEGAPVAGMRVRGEALDRPDPNEGWVVVREGELQAVTDAAGRYALEGLAPGDYQLRTDATERHAAVGAAARAGSAGIDMVLPARRMARVHGTVADERGAPVAGVRIAAAASPEAEVRTDADGHYAIEMAFTEREPTHTLRFEAEGFAAQQHHIVGAQAEDGRRLDVTLTPARGTTTVSGVVRTREGRPVPGQRVDLRSRSPQGNRQARSDSSGRFTMASVEVGADYELRVWPEGMYRDYSIKPFEVGPDGAEVEIVLEPLSAGRLSGRTVDATGRAVSNVQLWVQSESAEGKWQPLVADASGRFALDSVPEGNLLFESRSSPYERIQGVRVVPDQDLELTLVLDRGDHTLEGRVLDERGNPRAGAQVRVRWIHQGPQARSASTRHAVTDSSGRFRFAQVGPGMHTLSASVPGYTGAAARLDVGVEAGPVELQIRPR